MRPRGRPPTPRARSIASEPVEIVSTRIFVALPRRMIEPSPNCLVMAETARSMFLARAGSLAAGEGAFARSEISGRAGAGLAMGFMKLDKLCQYGIDHARFDKSKRTFAMDLFPQSTVWRTRKEGRGPPTRPPWPPPEENRTFLLLAGKSHL